MTTPTPAEITAALDTLHRMPYVRSDTTLAEIKAANTPFWRMVHDILGQLDSDRLPNPAELGTILATSAARHGLRITTDPDPGELVGYAYVAPCPNSTGWYQPTAGSWQPDDLDMARESVPEGGRTVALYLLPEGGQQ